MGRPYVNINRNNISEKLLKHLDGVLPGLKSLPGVVGITLNGGISRGYADHLSEIDVTIYLDPDTYKRWHEDKSPVPLLVSLLFWIVSDGVPAFMAVFFMSLFLILLYSAFYIIPILRFKEEKVKEITYRFSDEGIQMEGGDTLVKLGWNNYKAVFITPSMYIFKLGPRSYWGLPADAIPDRFAFDRLIYSQKEKSGLKVKVF